MHESAVMLSVPRLPYSWDASVGGDGCLWRDGWRDESSGKKGNESRRFGKSLRAGGKCGRSLERIGDQQIIEKKE